MSELQEQVISKVLDGLAAGSIHSALLAADFSVWTANCGNLNSAAFLSRLKRFSGVFKTSLQLTVTGVPAQGDRVAVEVESSGTLINDVEYSNRYHFLFLFPGDRIRLFREYTDTKRVVDLVRPLMDG